MNVEPRVAPGCLYLCATPIGNLEDITLRVLRVLGEVDWVAAEDTRHTGQLLHHFEITTPMLRYHEHNKRSSGEKIIQYLLEGQSVALVTDAGMPGISDPGELLVQQAIEAEIPITCLPGPSAVLTALAGSGLATTPFTFIGFLPRKGSQRRKLLATFSSSPTTLVLYEAPHRIRETLRDLQVTLGDRPMAIARELTKKFEEVRRGTVAELEAQYQEIEPRGEFVLVIAAPPIESTENLDPLPWDQLADEVSQLIQQGMKCKLAVTTVAKNRKVNSDQLYQEYHLHRSEQME